MGKRPWLHRVSLEQLIAVAATAISVVFLVAFGGQIVEIYRLRSALAIAEGQVERLRSERAMLEATRVYVESDEYAEQVARAELNKIRPGDQRTIIVPRPAPAPTPVPTPLPQPTAPAGPYYRSWWELLFGQ